GEVWHFAVRFAGIRVDLLYVQAAAGGYASRIAVVARNRQSHGDEHRMEAVRHQVTHKAVAILEVLSEAEEAVRIPILRHRALAIGLPIDVVVTGRGRTGILMNGVLPRIVAIAVPFANSVVAAVVAMLPHHE